MRSTLITVLLCAAAVSAPGADKNTAAPASRAIIIPKDAVASPDGASYTWTDKDGKKWLFVKTPFGIMKSAAADQPANAAVDSAVRLTESGDMVKFERPGPFGTIRWEKKKSDLTDDERRMLDAQNAKAAPAETVNADQK